MVLAVNISPKTVDPEIITVPDNVALLVQNVFVELGGEAKWVTVSALRDSKL